jgi:hypothetical protein
MQQRLLLEYTSAAHTWAINPSSKSVTSFANGFVVYETVVLDKELLSFHDVP